MHKLPLSLTVGTVSAGASNRQAFADEIAAKLLAFVSESILPGKLGGTEPASDEGIWVKNNRFYSWNSTLSDYEMMGFDMPIRPVGLISKSDTASPNTTLLITSEAVPLRNAASNSVILLRDVSTTSNIGLGVAPNGLATGSSETADTWYHCWLMSNGSQYQTRLNTSYIAPPVVSGYQYSCYIGPVRNDVSSNLIVQCQQDRMVYVNNFVIFSGLVATTLNTYQDVDTGATNALSKGIPPNARAVRVSFGSGPNGTYLAVVLSSSSTGLFESHLVQDDAAIDTNNFSVLPNPFWQPIVTSQKLWWKATYSVAAGYTHRLVVNGYSF